MKDELRSKVLYIASLDNKTDVEYEWMGLDKKQQKQVLESLKVSSEHDIGYAIRHKREILVDMHRHSMAWPIKVPPKSKVVYTKTEEAVMYDLWLTDEMPEERWVERRRHVTSG